MVVLFIWWGFFGGRVGMCNLMVKEFLSCWVGNLNDVVCVEYGCGYRKLFVCL